METPTTNGEKWRNEDGTFKKGHPPHPGAGRPLGSISIIGRIKQIFEEDPGRFEEYVQDVLNDKTLRKEIIEQIDNKPSQRVEIEHRYPQNLIEAIRLANGLNGLNPRIIEGEYQILPGEDQE